nr:unnamed protein product [Digitaria exilis]
MAGKSMTGTVSVPSMSKTTPRSGRLERGAAEDMAARTPATAARRPRARGPRSRRCGPRRSGPGMRSICVVAWRDLGRWMGPFREALCYVF